MKRPLEGRPGATLVAKEVQTRRDLWSYDTIMQIAETSICISLKLDVKQSPSGLDDSITVIRAVGGNARAFTGAHPPHAALGVPNPINVDETLRPAIDLDEVAGEFNTLSPPALFLFGRPGARCSSIDQRLSIAGRWRIAWYDMFIESH